jgi:hypothetical protein
MKVNAKYVNPFIEAAMKVVKQITGIEVRRGHLTYKAKVGFFVYHRRYLRLPGGSVVQLDNPGRAPGGKLLGGNRPGKKIMFVDTWARWPT